MTVTAKTNAQIFEIDVQDRIPARAATLANDVAETLINQQESQHENPTGHDTSATNGFLFLVQPAQPSNKPVSPNTLLNLAFGLLAGLFLGMLLALVLEQVDTRVRTVKTLTRLVDWPVLASVRYIKRSRKKAHSITSNHPVDLETYRQLRHQIGFAAMGKSLRFIMVTSATSKEGKSTIAANLAIAMARAGKNTLLIDANLRQPTLHDSFHLPPDTKGLSNALLAFSGPSSTSLPVEGSSLSSQELGRVPLTNSPLKPYVHPLEIANLWLMPSGPYL